MSEEGRKVTKVAVNSWGSGSLWLIGWLFTIGYLKLAFWPAVLALFIWPYDLGVAIR
jgi:hypothetical protein